MIENILLRRAPVGCARRGRGAFTLIELLTVMAIIVILAGLILSTAGYANRRAASSRAQGEIKALETAINSYQIDNGAVPRDATTTDVLDARKDAGSSGSGSPDNYKSASLFLFKALSGYFEYDSDGLLQVVQSGTRKIYFPFKGNQVAPGGTGTGSATLADGSINPAKVTYIVDPFGLSYGYSTVALAEADKNLADGVTKPQSQGFNPTFDLWSTSGYGGGGGKPYPSSATAPDKSTLWITNWGQ